MSRRIPPTPVAAPWNGSTAEGWLCDSTLNATASPSPTSITPAFSPGPCSTRGPSEGSLLSRSAECLYPQCSDHRSEKTASSKWFGSRASSSRIRSSSSSVSPRARCSGCSGATCVKGSSVTGRPDRPRVRFPAVSRRPLPMLLALAAIWGSSFLFIKVAVREVSPGEVVFGRVLVGTLGLLPAVWFLGGWGPTWAGLRRFWRPLLLVGIFNAALPFWLLAWSEKKLDSGLAAVLQASMPLFTAGFVFFVARSERVTGLKLVGVVVGFLGVLLLVGAQPSGDVLSALAVLLTALLYAGSSVYAAKRLRDAPVLVISLGALAFATVATLPLGIAQLPGELPSWKVIAAIVALGAAGLSVAYLLYFSLIAGSGAPYAALVTYLVPALALVYGAVFLDEAVTASALGGLALILAGVALGTGTLKLDRIRPRAGRLSSSTRGGGQ